MCFFLEMLGMLGLFGFNGPGLVSGPEIPKPYALNPEPFLHLGSHTENLNPKPCTLNRGNFP